MEQLIRNITSRLTDKLSDDKPFYTPDDLREYDFPEFLIQRVEVEIYRNLNESIVPPHSEWADMDAAEVELAWEKFIDAIVAEVRMPVSFAPTVFETAIADVLEMILQPRKSIPEILFGPKEKLTVDELEKRLSFVSVNTHLATAIQKYVQRKGMSEIGIGAARHVVRRVDERVTANYNSLNWAQLLNPLFILAGPSIDTELFRIFFRDRNMDRISRRFDILNGSLTKIEFIETLSSPDLLNEEGYEDDQASLFDVSTPESGHDVPKTDDGDVGDVDNTTSGSMLKNPETRPLSDSDEITPTSYKEDTPISKRPEDGSDSSESIISSYSEKNIGSPDENVAGATDLKSIRGETTETNQTDDSILGAFQNPAEIEEEVEREINSDLSLKSPENGSVEPTLADATGDLEDEREETPLYSTFESENGVFGDRDDEEDSETPERVSDIFVFGEETEPGEDLDVYDEDSDYDPFSESEGESENEGDRDRGESLSQNLSGLSGYDESQQISETEENTDDEMTSEEESPIWQSFLKDEEHVNEGDIPEFSAYADLEEDDSENEAEGEVEEEPIIDLTKSGGDIKSADHLIGWMQDDEERFVSNIFSGSNRAYEETLIDLDQLSNWAQASRFIEKEIFARNHVDMYDEVAVDFTDRLQAYFDEFKS